MGTETYFTSYEDLEIHKLMLDDRARNEAYRKAILANRDFLNNKIVMDVGCGTGILSVYCAQAGAKKVYAVEASNLAEIAQQTAKDNGYENVIEVIHSKVENVTLDIKVDAIVSEWMGFYLLHEGMLESVMVARDKFLKEDGRMFPESAAIYAAPCSIPSLFEHWDEVDGAKLTSFGKNLRKNKASKPEIMIVQPEEILTKEVALCWLDLKEDKIEDLKSYSAKQVVSTNKSGKYQGICVWFECYFPGDGERVTLGTGPADAPTHWKQTVVVLQEELQVDENEPIAFQLDMSRDENESRRYNLQLTLLDPEKEEHPLPCDCHMTKCIVVKAYLSQHPDRNADEITQVDSCIVDEPIDDEDDL